MLVPEDWVIYKFTNLINGLGYIGQDKSGHRLADHLWCATHGCPPEGCGGTSALHAAMKQYGLESFDYEILEIGFSCQIEINEAENRCILEYETLKPQGYNKTLNSTTPGRWGGEAPEEFERILDYLPSEKEQIVEEGVQIIEIQKGNAGRKTPDWINSDKKIRQILSDAFPKHRTNSYQRGQAGRWARYIQLYFRLKFPSREVAAEMGLSLGSARILSTHICRVAQGYRANGSSKRGLRPSGRPKKSRSN